jgi:hypothetical protein
MFFAGPEQHRENTLGGGCCYLENGKAGRLHSVKVHARIHREERVAALPTPDAQR